MANVILPFLVPMLLGRTIDLTTYKIGKDIYDYADNVETPRNTAKTTFMVLQDNVLPYSQFGLPIDIVLRIKAEMLSTSSGLSGLEGLLRQTDWYSNSAIVAVGSIVQTVQRTLKDDAHLLPNWNSHADKNQTHYVNSLLYGGWRVVLFGYHCDLPADVQIVKRMLTQNLGEVGNLKKQTIAKWNSAIRAINKNKKIRGKVRVHVHTFSTVPLKQAIKTPENLLESFLKFPTEVGQVGQPIFMELRPLHDLDSTFPAVNENQQMDEDLARLDHMYDDIKNTRNYVVKWVSHTLSSFTDQEEQEMLNFLNNLKTCIRLFQDAISETSLFRALESNTLTIAELKYMRGLKGAESYDSLFKLLKEKLNDECQDRFHHKIKGLLKVKRSESIELGHVKGGLEQCKTSCAEDPRCRSIGYADQISKLELIEMKDDIGQYKMVTKVKQCWIYFRSTSTARVFTPEGINTAGVYDRVCP